MRFDSGDIQIDSKSGSLQAQLFDAIRQKILNGLWSKGGKLPSTRKLSEELHLSRNTVIFVYDQLIAEGYIYSKKGSGCYVAVELPEEYLLNTSHTHVSHIHDSLTSETNAQLPVSCLSKSKSPNLSSGSSSNLNSSFAPGVPDLAAFPHQKWQRMLQRHSGRECLLGAQNIQGDQHLRTVISHYLASSRSVSCNESNIIITSGAQQALTITLMAILDTSGTVMMESPGYAQVTKVIDLLRLQMQPINVLEQDGLQLHEVFSYNSDVLYLTPSNQYPLGTTLNLEQRVDLIQWAKAHRRWIIEDDYDSEFQFSHRPYPSLQGVAAKMAAEDQVVYIGSFSKVMFNGLRLGYMVVPNHLVARCLAIKDALSGDTPSHVQAALASFISEGDLLRHIRKVRRLYKAKHEAMVCSIDTHFQGRVRVISQAAGLHITIKWLEGPAEKDWSERAAEKGIIVRPLSFYESAQAAKRRWQGMVLGFGNVALEDIDGRIGLLAEVFFDKSSF